MALLKPKVRGICQQSEVPCLWNLQKLWSKFHCTCFPKGFNPLNHWNLLFNHMYIKSAQLITLYKRPMKVGAIYIVHGDEFSNSLFFKDRRHVNTSEWRSLPHAPSQLVIQTSTCPATGKIRNKRQLGIKKLGRFKFTPFLFMRVVTRQFWFLHVGIGYAAKYTNYAKTLVVLH